MQPMKSGVASLPRVASALRSRIVRVGGLVLLVVLAACAAAPGPQPGQSRESVLQTWGPPTGRYALPEGRERLEYATGPWGRVTWMIDVDGAGRVLGATQVLNERHFADFQARVPGMEPAEVLRELGRPGERRKVGWQGGETWSWRYPTNDCLWFQVSFDKALRATSAGYGIDPTCDAPSERR
jgi:hypothetical protein